MCRRNRKKDLLLPSHRIWLLRAVNLLLIVLLAWMSAALVWRFAAPAPAMAPASPLSAGASVQQPLNRIDANLIAPLFGGAGKDDGAANSVLPYKLRGVIAAGKGRGAAALLSGTGPKDAAFRVGDELQPGVVLQEVNPDHVLVDNHGRRERIELDAKPAARLDSRSAAAADPGLIKPVGATDNVGGAVAQILPISMPRARLVTAMQGGNVAEWATGLRADARKGIRIEAGSARGLVQTLQLQEGDMLQRINGRLLSHPGDIALVYNEFSQKNKIQLDVLRNDRPLTLDYMLQP